MLFYWYNFYKTIPIADKNNDSSYRDIFVAFRTTTLLFHIYNLGVTTYSMCVLSNHSLFKCYNITP